MQKLLTGIAFILAMAVVHATTNDNTKVLSDAMIITGSHIDTVPSDTTKKDSLQFGSLAYNLTDTVPKDTTTKDTMFASAVAYRLVADIVPADTTKKDTTFQTLAFNR